MALVVNTNISSLAAQRNLSVNQASLAKSVEHLSSGLRITRASDDAAGLGVPKPCERRSAASTKPPGTRATASA